MSITRRFAPAPARPVGKLATAVACAGAALMIAAGCSSSPSTGGAGGAGGAGFAGMNEPAADRGAPMDPVRRSSLRERALDALETFALDSNAQLRANAIEALHTAPSRAAPFARAGLADENLGVRFVAAMTAGRLRLAELADHVQPLLRDESPMVRAAAIYALTNLGREVDPTPLAGMLRADDARVRAQAAFILGELGNPSAIPMLRQAAQRDVPRAPLAEVRLMRLQIAEALVKLGESSAMETIRAALYPSRPEELEATALAVQIIGQVRDRRSIDNLIYLTARTDEQRLPAEVRLAAAASLAQLGVPRGAFIADEYLRDPAPTLRAQAAYVYGETGQSENLERLERLLDDDYGLVSVAAAAGILKITERLAEQEASSISGVQRR